MFRIRMAQANGAIYQMDALCGMKTKTVIVLDVLHCRPSLKRNFEIFKKKA